MIKYSNIRETGFDRIIMFFIKIIFIPIIYVLKILFYFCSIILNFFLLMDEKINKPKDIKKDKR